MYRYFYTGFRITYSSFIYKSKLIKTIHFQKSKVALKCIDTEYITNMHRHNKIK